jgi:hypothetical protein
VTKLLHSDLSIWSHFGVLLKSDLDVQQPGFTLFNIVTKLIQGIKVLPNYYIQTYKFGPTMMCSLSLTWMFSKPALGASTSGALSITHYFGGFLILSANIIPGYLSFKHSSLLFRRKRVWTLLTLARGVLCQKGKRQKLQGI